MQGIKIFGKRLQKSWQFLLQISTWVLTILLGFILPPPIWDFEQHHIWYKFAYFLVAVLIGLLFVPLSRWTSRQSTVLWLVITILALISGVVAFFQYQSLRDDWTVAYSKKTIIIGSQYSEDALNYKSRIKDEENREVSDKELVMAAAGKTENLWDEKEVKWRGRVLAALYLVTIALFATTIITLIQVLYCNSQSPKQSRKITSKSELLKK